MIPSKDLLNPKKNYENEIIPKYNFNEIRDTLINRKAVLTGLLCLLGVSIVSWHLYYALELPITRRRHTALHLVLFVPVLFLTQFTLDATNRRERVHNLTTALFLVLGVVSTVYGFYHFERWMLEGRHFIYTNTDLLVGAALILVFVYGAWKAFGVVFAIITAAGFGYGLYGPYFPGALGHSGFSLERLIAMNSISVGGVYSSITFVVATWVVIFILYAGMIEGYGGLEYIMKLGTKAQSLFSSGVVQASVLSSLFVGSINAASAANVATTGSFTIPMMKENGIRARTAAAVESLASTGGQIMPPVMGTASFLIADFVGIEYGAVLVAALLPALAFYFTVSFTSHLTALKHGWIVRSDNTPTTDGGRGDVDGDAVETDGGTETFDDDLEMVQEHSVGDHLLFTLPYLGSLGIIIYYLVFAQYDPMTAGTYAVLTLIGLALLRDLLIEGISRYTVLNWGVQTVAGCKRAAVMMAPITAVVVPIAIIINIFSATGLPQLMAFELVSLAGGSLVLLLILTMIACILMGLGIPTVAAYLLVAMFVAPALSEFGVDPLVAHMFVFYFAVLSTITPPIALSCAVASGIADTGFLGVCYKTIQIGCSVFLIPFVFVVNPELVLWNNAGVSLATFVLICGGIASLSFALVGYDGYRRIPRWKRAPLAAIGAGILLVPNLTLQAGLFAAVVAYTVSTILTETDWLARLPTP